LEVQPTKVIQAYVMGHYGNLISSDAPVFDSVSRTWVAELRADYPRILRDDERPNHTFVKFLSLRGLGEVRLAENLTVEDATTRTDCVLRVDTLLARWRQRAEDLVVSATASELARIGKVKDSLNPIVMIISNFLRPDREMITNSEIDREPRPQRMRQYFRFLEQISLLEETTGGYKYAPLFTELRKSAKDNEDFMTKIIGHVIEKHYPTIKDFFEISRFEPFVHMDNCYYAYALQAEELLARKENSLMDQFSRWYGTKSQMRLRSILDELVRVRILDYKGGFYYGRDEPWQAIMSLRDQLPTELAPLRA